MSRVKLTLVRERRGKSGERRVNGSGEPRTERVEQNARWKVAI